MTAVTPFRVVKPLDITDETLVACNVPEADYAEWALTTNYSLGERVIRVETHKIYESAAGNNLGNIPETSPMMWIEVSPTNKWKMFDGSNSTQTRMATEVSCTLRPLTPVNALGVLNFDHASSLHVVVTHSTYGTMYDQTVDLSSVASSAGWWEFFFGARTTKTQAIILDLPAIPGADISITLSGDDSLAIGVLMVGEIREFSDGVNYGAKLGIQDYSRKETNEWGDTVLIQRAYARRASFSLQLPATQVDTTLKLLADLRATPCLWIASTLYEGATIFGFYKEFEILISYPTFSDCTLEIEGLT